MRAQLAGNLRLYCEEAVALRRRAECELSAHVHMGLFQLTWEMASQVAHPACTRTRFCPASVVVVRTLSVVSCPPVLTLPSSKQGKVVFNASLLSVPTHVLTAPDAPNKGGIMCFQMIFAQRILV